MSIAFFGAINFELFGMKDGGFDPQHTALFIIDFEGVTAEIVTQSDAFCSLFKASGDLAFESGMDFAALQCMAITQEAQYIGTLKALDGVMDKLGIESGQVLGLIEENIGRVLALRGAPVVVQPLHETDDLAVQRMS